MFNVETPRTSLVEVVIPTTFNGTLQKVKFLNQEQLMSVTGKRVYLKGVSLLSADFMPSSPLTSGLALASAIDIGNATVTLSAENDVFLDQCPAPEMVGLRNNLATTSFSQNGIMLLDDVYNIDWTKCFVTVIAAPIALPISYLFNFYYGYMPRRTFALNS